MSAEDNKTIVRRVYDEAINNGNFIVVNESFTDDYIYRSPGSPEFHGPDGFKQLVTTYRTAFPDLHIQLDELIVEGDTVVSRYTACGTQLGELMGVPPTGKYVTGTGVVISHFRGGKAADEWELIDIFGVMQQLAVIPMPEPAVAAAH